MTTLNWTNMRREYIQQTTEQKPFKIVKTKIKMDKKSCFNWICIKMNENHTMIIAALNFNWHIKEFHLRSSSDRRDSFYQNNDIRIEMHEEWSRWDKKTQQLSFIFMQFVSFRTILNKWIYFLNVSENWIQMNCAWHPPMDICILFAGKYINLSKRLNFQMDFLF